MEAIFNVQHLLRYPFAMRENPNSEVMEQTVTTEWLDKYYFFLPQAARQKYLDTKIGYCAGCIFPSAKLAHLHPICRFFIWAFTIDDSFEHSTPEKVKEIAKISLAILRGEAQAPDHPLFAQLPTLRQELFELASPTWMNRFIGSLEIYFEGLAAEIPWRKSMTFPDMDTFVDIRMKAVNVYPMIHLAELISGVILPEKVINHPQIQEMMLLTCRILAFCNDLYSAHQERGTDVLNLVLMIEHHEKCSLYSAYEKALAIHDADVMRIKQLSENQEDFGIFAEPVNDFIQNMLLMATGYNFWTIEHTNRYNVGGHAGADLKKAEM